MSKNALNVESWQSPPAIFRGAPFWGWNAKLDSGRLRRQVEEMKKGGMGGFFMHSRYGLKTEYLSPVWFRCVKACIDKARELDMKACLYDEDRWASGTAGGDSRLRLAWNGVTIRSKQPRCGALEFTLPCVPSSTTTAEHAEESTLTGLP